MSHRPLTLHSQARITYETHGSHHFFGYYDKCPWNKSGETLLALEADFLDRLPGPQDAARIGAINLSRGGSFHAFAETRAWNWQQGAMLQWLPPKEEFSVIFNDLRGDKFVSSIFDIRDGKEKRELPFPIYSLHPSGRHALSLNFSRLDNVREGYGYKGIRDKRVGNPAPADDGIYRINLETGDVSLLLSLAQLRSHQFVGSMDEGKHWVDHLAFSPNGDQFAFLHRWQLKNGGMHSRFCAMRFNPVASGVDSQTPSVLLDSGMASHFIWRNNRELVIWGRPLGFSTSITKPGLLRKILVPVYHALVRSSGSRQKISGDAFLSFIFEDGAWRTKKPLALGRGIIKEDGHCSFSPDGEWLLTDTYPTKDHFRVLELFHRGSGKKAEIGRFYSLPERKFGVGPGWDLSALRSDLHPRWNRNGTAVCIDSVHSGARQMHVIDIQSMLNSH